MLHDIHTALQRNVAPQYNRQRSFKCTEPTWSRDGVVGIATGYGLDDRRLGFRVPVRSRTSSFPRHRDRVWGPSSLPSDVCQGFLPGGKAVGTASWQPTCN
jgi:hypothetical protein